MQPPGQYIILHDAVDGIVALVPTGVSGAAGCASVHTILHWCMCMPAHAQAGLGILTPELNPWPAGCLAHCSVLMASEGIPQQEAALGRAILSMLGL